GLLKLPVPAPAIDLAAVALGERAPGSLVGGDAGEPAEQGGAGRGCRVSSHGSRLRGRETGRQRGQDRGPILACLLGIRKVLPLGFGAATVISGEAHTEYTLSL